MNTDMNELAARLRESDPLLHEDQAALAPSEIAQMRAAVLAAADTSVAVSRRLGTFALAATFVLAVALAVIAARRSATERLIAARPDGVVAPRLNVTQVHFSTPGGTRVIWTLDPSFELKAAEPLKGAKP
jgi:hypothetical protein